MTRARVALTLAVLFLLFAGLGRLPLMDPDEGRYARSAQEMIERGDYVVPHLNGLPRLQKPVLFYWLEAASFAALGFTETAARIPSALAACGTLLWLFLFARRRSGERTALAACAVLATTPLFFALARTATTDMVLTFFVFGATASLYAGIVEPAAPRRHLVVAGICLGLGLLVKGPVALVVPTLAIPAAAIARRREPITIAGRAAGVAWIMLAVVLPWAAMIVHRLGLEEVLAVWQREAFERYAGGGLDHPEAVSYYLMTAPLTLFPWSAFIPIAALSALRRLKWGDGLNPLLLVWSAGLFAFLSLGRGKLDSYLLPLTPAVAYMIALILTREEESEWMVRWTSRVMAAFALVLLAPFLSGRIQGHAPAALPAAALAAAGAAGLLSLLAYLRRERLVLGAFAAAMGCVLLGAVFFIPLTWAAERSTRDLARQADLAGTSGTLYTLRLSPPSLGFYARRNTTHVPARATLMKALEAPHEASVVLEASRSNVIRQLLDRGFRVTASSGRFVVMRRGPPGDRERG